MKIPSTTLLYVFKQTVQPTIPNHNILCLHWIINYICEAGTGVDIFLVISDSKVMMHYHASATDSCFFFLSGNVVNSLIQGLDFYFVLNLSSTLVQLMAPFKHKIPLIWQEMNSYPDWDGVLVNLMHWIKVTLMLYY